MDRCVLLTSTPEWVVSPRRAITRTQPEIITWFPSLSTNILLIKSKLKLESRAIVVGVAMPPRNLGGKYRCRPHPGGEYTRAIFFSGSRACQSNCIRVASSLGDNIIDDVVCLKALAHCPFRRKWRVLHIRYISALEQVGMSFNGIAYLMKV